MCIAAHAVALQASATALAAPLMLQLQACLVATRLKQGQADRWPCGVLTDAVCLCSAVRFVDTPDFSGPASGFGGKKDDAIVEGVVSYKLKQGQAPPVDLSYYAETGKMGGHMVALL